ncbi:MAG: hypothetical protein R3Y21_00935 [Mycoplasmatota bacterium]
MDTVIGKFEDKNCSLTLYFRETKLMLLFIVDKYKPDSVVRIFNKKKELGVENFKLLFKIILTDNGWEFSKPSDIKLDLKTKEKISNIFYCVPYSSWQKGGIEITKKLHLKYIKEDEVSLSYKILK